MQVEKVLKCVSSVTYVVFLELTFTEGHHPVFEALVEDELTC